MWLIVHIAAAGAWLGMDLVLGVLVVTALVATDPQTVSVALQAVELFAVWPVAIAGVVCLASGIVLGLGTKYGLVRYWWVFVKLVMNIVLLVLVVVVLPPGVREAAEIGRALTGDVPSGMLFPPVVSTAAVLFATVISVLKPWGRLRKDTP
nr:membrane protein [Kibdelosporangium sp. MJ126-NF4]CTQ89531.1 membrane protein [Kibdelosporangium sp. MJ126-NF4]